MNWLRWYVGTSTDAKLHKASRLAHVRRSAVIAAWAAILEEARRNGDDGAIGEVEASWLGCQIDEPETKCERIIQAMRDVGMIDEKRVCSFSRRQSPSDDSAARIRVWRAKRLENKETDPECNVTCNEHVTTCNGQTRTEQTLIPPVPSEHAPKGANGHTKPKSEERGKRLPDDWRPSESAIAYCRTELGASGEILNREYPAFMDWGLSAAGPASRKRNWDRAFVNWMRRVMHGIREQEARERRWAEQRGRATH